MAIFSIIIPVYQAERYIERCVNSIKKQEFTDWELILVDDGSTDHSSEICDALSEQNSRIRVIHKENGGAASARNAGVREAGGEYILFLDSDDYWEGDNVLSQIIDQCKKRPDICLFGCFDEFEDTKQRVQSRGMYDAAAFSSGDRGTILISLIQTNQFPGSCWIMAVKNSLLKENRIQFPEGNHAEDIDWILSVLCAAQTFSYVEKPFYIYTKNRKHSITGTAGRKSIESILSTIEKWSPILQKQCSGEVYTALNSYLTFEFLTTLVIYHGLTGAERKNIRKRMKKAPLDWGNIAGRKIKLAGWIYRILGVRLASKAFFMQHHGH